jgi:hypothetical protein
MTDEDTRLGDKAQRRSDASVGRAGRGEPHRVIDLPQQDESESNPDNPVVLPRSDLERLISLSAKSSHGG